MKNKFPIFAKHKELVYLDSAATTQRPKEVVDAITQFYFEHNANVKRGIYDLSEIATELYKNAKQKVASFIGAQENELVFTKGTTDSINLIAQSWGEKNIKAGDEIVVTILEHHSNFVPWQKLAERKSAILKIVPVNANGFIDFEDFRNVITPKTKLVAITQMSNVLGTNFNVKEIAKLAHAVGAKILVDAAQSVSHQAIDVKDLDCDFLAFSAHKMFGPTGIGALFIKENLIKDMEPIQFGGGMVFEVGVDKITILEGVEKFEAGTPAIAEAIGFGAAVDFIKNNINFVELQKHISSLSTQLIKGLKDIKGVRALGDKGQSIISFIVEGYHSHDVAAYLNSFSICVRAGHHCAQPFFKSLGLDGAIRVSFHAYNDAVDVEKLLAALNTLDSNLTLNINLNLT